MEIVLVRHGKPASVPSDSIAGHEIGHWVRRYNDAGISRELPPPSSVQRLVASNGCVVASDLRRSVESGGPIRPYPRPRLESAESKCWPDQVLNEERVS
jgi:hypothetical protein